MTAGSVLGLSRNVSYQLAAAGQFPIRILHLGARYRVPVAALLKLLEIEPLDHRRDQTVSAVVDPDDWDVDTSRAPVVSKVWRLGS